MQNVAICIHIQGVSKLLLQISTDNRNKYYNKHFFIKKLKRLHFGELCLKTFNDIEFSYFQLINYEICMLEIWNT